MKKLNELEQSIYNAYIKIKPSKLKRVEEIRNRKKTRYIEFCFPSGPNYVFNTLMYDKTLNKFTSIRYPYDNGSEVEFKIIEL